VALVFGFAAQSFRLVVVLVSTRPSSSKGRCKTFHQPTQLRIGSGLDGARRMLESAGDVQDWEAPSLSSRAATPKQRICPHQWPSCRYGKPSRE
jgi:hypothetical protein